MTLSMNMAVFGKHYIIKRVNIVGVVVTMENSMILTNIKNFLKRNEYVALKTIFIHNYSHNHMNMKMDHI